LVADLAEDALLEQLEGVLDRLGQSRVLLDGEPAPGEEAATVVVPALLVANKCDASEAAERVDILRELYGDRFPILRVSAQTGEGLDALRDAIYRRLEIVRVFSKPPGKKPDLDAPFVLKQGSTVMDLAGMVHKD